MRTEIIIGSEDRGEKRRDVNARDNRHPESSRGLATPARNEKAAVILSVLAKDLSPDAASRSFMSTFRMTIHFFQHFQSSEAKDLGVREARQIRDPS
jgi:hypothetical protein